MPSNCTIISWKGKKKMASLLKGSKGGGAPVARSGSGPGPGRCFPVFPKGPASAAQRGLWHPSGLWPSVPRVVEKGCIASLRGPPIGGQDRDGASYRCSAPYTLCLFEAFPSRGNERYGEKNRASYTSCTIPVFPPLVAGATTFPPQAGALWLLSNGAMFLQKSIERFILPPEQGAVRRSRIGGGERSEPITRMLIMPYDTESQSRNALVSP